MHRVTSWQNVTQYIRGKMLGVGGGQEKEDNECMWRKTSKQQQIGARGERLNAQFLKPGVTRESRVTLGLSKHGGNQSCKNAKTYPEIYPRGNPLISG